MENVNFKVIYQLLFFNKDISPTPNVIDLKFPVCIANLILEEIVSQNFDLGLGSYFMAKNF